jgi:fluoride exporter
MPNGMLYLLPCALAFCLCGKRLSLLNCIAVGIGGFIGSILRYLIGLLPMKPTNGFPLGTLIINVAGSFAIGLIVSLSIKTGNVNSRWILFLKAGICGGFTTFSTFSLEATQLLQNGKVWLGSLYIFVSVLLGIGAFMLAQYTVSR